MIQDEIIRKNLDLHKEFMDYVFDHPETLEMIPKEAHLVFLPEDDPELSKINLETTRVIKSKEKDAVFVMVHMRPAEKTVKVMVPHLESAEVSLV